MPETVASFRDGSGEPLVLLHGFTMAWHMWRPLLPALVARHDVFAPTLPGHLDGCALADGAVACVSTIADALERELDAAGIGTGHLVGNSLGGWLAFELARRGRAQSVVAIAPAGGWERGDSEEQRLERLFHVGYRLSQLVDRHGGALVRRPRSRRAILRSAMEHGERVSAADAAAIVHAAAACPIYLDLLDAIERDGPAQGLDEVRAPTLIAWPTKDKILPFKIYAQRYADAIPGAELVELPDVGHSPMWDDPALIASTILGFSARHAVRDAVAT